MAVLGFLYCDCYCVKIKEGYSRNSIKLANKFIAS